MLDQLVDEMRASFPVVLTHKKERGREATKDQEGLHLPCGVRSKMWKVDFCCPRCQPWKSLHSKGLSTTVSISSWTSSDTIILQVHSYF